MFVVVFVGIVIVVFDCLLFVMSHVLIVLGFVVFSLSIRFDWMGIEHAVEQVKSS